MNEPIGMFIDAGLAEHWPDLFVVTLLAVLGWLVIHLVGGIENRLDDTDAQVDRSAACINEHEKRLTAMETIARERERREQIDRDRGR